VKIETSISLSENLLREIDQRSAQYKNRSDFLEVAAWALIAQMSRDEQDARDRAILDQKSEELNREAMDVLACVGNSLWTASSN
jgi:metal-responsive CopG/Arc/MetJ family transcriptional regulator